MVLAQEEAARTLQEKQVQNILKNTPAWQGNNNKPQDCILQLVEENKRLHIQYWDSLSLTFLCHCGVSHPFLTSLLCSGLLVFLSSFIFACRFLLFSLRYTPPLRSTHSNQCMSPTSPTYSGLRYEPSMSDLHQWATTLTGVDTITATPQNACNAIKQPCNKNGFVGLVRFCQIALFWKVLLLFPAHVILILFCLPAVC